MKKNLLLTLVLAVVAMFLIGGGVIGGGETIDESEGVLEVTIPVAPEGGGMEEGGGFEENFGGWPWFHYEDLGETILGHGSWNLAYG